MSDLFKKLNLKDEEEIFILNAPASFAGVIDTLHDVEIKRTVDAASVIKFSLAFAEKKADLDHYSALVSEKAEGDAVLWFAYPKGSSKKYKCDFNRDTGWEVLMEAGFRPVRQVSIDEDWSALRFRRTEYVKPSK